MSLLILLISSIFILMQFNKPNKHINFDFIDKLFSLFFLELFSKIFFIKVFVFISFNNENLFFFGEYNIFYTIYYK
jgi:hypothetical protein